MIDCTGDGDLFHRAGAGGESDTDERDIHHCTNTAWLFGGVDMARWIAFKTGEPEGFKAFMERGRGACGGLFERPFVSWRDDVALFLGPRLAGYSAVDVEDQTEVEIRSHRLMAQHLAVYREHTPGFTNALTCCCRRRSSGCAMRGASSVSAGLRARTGRTLRRGPTRSASRRRCHRSDPSSHSFLREIPQCWLTGQAAGVAAALAAAERCAPRVVPIAELQAALRQQQVLLSADVEPALAPAGETAEAKS